MKIIKNDWLYFYNRYFFELGKVIYKKEYTYHTVRSILKFLDGNYDVSILDLGCGFGRLTVPLAKKGLNIDGVDSSTSLLEIARKDANEAKISSSFYEQDIRRLDLHNSYDLIISMGHSIGFYSRDEEDQLIFDRVYKHLKPNGCFIIEIHNHDAFIRKCKPDEVIDLPMGEVSMKLERTYNSLKGSGGYRFTWNEDQAEYVAYLEFRIYTINETIAMLESAGLEVFKITGIDGGDLTLTSDSVIFYTKKNDGASTPVRG